MSDKFERLRQKSETLWNRTFQEFWAEAVECSELLKQLTPIARRPWISDVICQMYDEQDGRCVLTGDQLEPNFEVDHIVPVSYGGGNEKSNLRLVNRNANRSRGNRGVNPHDLLRYLEDRYQNR